MLFVEVLQKEFKKNDDETHVTILIPTNGKSTP